MGESEALTWHEFSTLATFNAEVSRGILHTKTWSDHMYKLQRRYDHHGWYDQSGNHQRGRLQ